MLLLLSPRCKRMATGGTSMGSQRLVHGKWHLQGAAQNQGSSCIHITVGATLTQSPCYAYTSVLTAGSQRNILNFASETYSTVPGRLCAPPSFWKSLHCSIKHAQGFPMHQLIFHTPGPGLMRASKRT